MPLGAFEISATYLQFEFNGFIDITVKRFHLTWESFCESLLDMFADNKIGILSFGSLSASFHASIVTRGARFVNWWVARDSNSDNSA